MDTTSKTSSLAPMEIRYFWDAYKGSDWQKANPEYKLGTIQKFLFGPGYAEQFSDAKIAEITGKLQDFPLDGKQVKLYVKSVHKDSTGTISVFTTKPSVVTGIPSFLTAVDANQVA